MDDDALSDLDGATTLGVCGAVLHDGRLGDTEVCDTGLTVDVPPHSTAPAATVLYRDAGLCRVREGRIGPTRPDCARRGRLACAAGGWRRHGHNLEQHEARRRGLRDSLALATALAPLPKPLRASLPALVLDTAVAADSVEL